MPAVFWSRDFDVYASLFELAVSYPDPSKAFHVSLRFVAVDILEDFEHVMENTRVLCAKGNAAWSFSVWNHEPKH